MPKALDETLSLEIAQTIKSKADKTFDNAYKAVLAIDKAKYVQGFLAIPAQPYQPREHGWVELADTNNGEFISIIDPNLPHLRKVSQASQELCYFEAQSFTLPELKAIIEESQEDYPEDDPLPVYGDAPYEYYGDVMLGGQEYLRAYQAAAAKCQEFQALSGLLGHGQISLIVRVDCRTV